MKPYYADDHIGCLFDHEHRYPECYDDTAPSPAPEVSAMSEHSDGCGGGCGTDEWQNPPCPAQDAEVA